MAYTKQQKETMFNKVIEYISNGMSLNTALKQDDVFSKTIWLELIADDDKNTQYTRAREERADKIFEELIDISDNVGQDLIKTPDGREIVNNAVIARDKLRVDTRKWMLSKMQPKKYGDKTEVEHSGEIKGQEPKINLVVDGKTFNLKDDSKEK